MLKREMFFESYKYLDMFSIVLKRYPDILCSLYIKLGYLLLQHCCFRPRSTSVIFVSIGAMNALKWCKAGDSVDLTR